MKAKLIQCSGVSVPQAIELASEYPMGRMKSSPQAKIQVIAVMGLYFFMSLGEGKEASERYEYHISLKNDAGHKDLFRNIMQIEGVSNVKLIRRDNSERL